MMIELFQAEADLRRLRKETGEDYEVEIIASFKQEEEARDYRKKMIQKFRGIFGKDKLPGNKDEE